MTSRSQDLPGDHRYEEFIAPHVKDPPGGAPGLQRT